MTECSERKEGIDFSWGTDLLPSCRASPGRAPGPLTALPSPRTAELRLPSSQKPSAAACTAAPGSIPACPWGLCRGLLAPRWATQHAQVPQCARAVLLGGRTGTEPLPGRCLWGQIPSPVHPRRCLQRLHGCWMPQAGFSPTSGSGTCTSSPSPETPANASRAFGPSLLRGGAREPSRIPGVTVTRGLCRLLKEQKDIWKMRNSVVCSYFGNLEWPPQQGNQLVLDLWFWKTSSLNVCVMPGIYGLLWR